MHDKQLYMQAELKRKEDLCYWPLANNAQSVESIKVQYWTEVQYFVGEKVRYCIAHGYSIGRLLFGTDLQRRNKNERNGPSVNL